MTTDTYDCPNDGVPKPERRKFPRGPADERVEHLFNGFENLIANLYHRDMYWWGYAKAMRDSFAELMRLRAVPGDMVLVPREPTLEMRLCGEEWVSNSYLVRKAWDAMVAAAPTAAAPAGGADGEAV